MKLVNDMDNKDNFFDKIDEGQKKALSKTKTFINDNLVFLLLIFVIAVQIVSKLYTVDSRNIFELSFFLDLSVSTSYTVLVYLVYAPLGTKKEALRSESFHTNVKRWATLSEHIRNGLSDAFSLFCKKREDDERIDKRREIIQNNTMIDFKEYLHTFLPMPQKELKALYKSKKLTHEEYKAIKRANRVHKVAPINPLLVLCGVEGMTLNDAGRNSSTGFERWIVTRPVVIPLTNIVFNSIKPTFIGLNNADAVYVMLLSCLGTIIAAYTGYSRGVARQKKRNDIIKNRIFFIEIFMEEYKKNNVCVPD